MNKNNSKKIVSIVSTLIFFVLFIFYFLSDPTFFEIIKTTNLSFLIVVLFFCFLRMIILSYLNMFLYRFINIELEFKECFRIVFINRAGNQLLPLKFGSGYKLHYFVNKLKTPISTYMSINTGQVLISLFINTLILFFVVNILSNTYSQELLNLVNTFLILLILIFLSTSWISLKITNVNNKLLKQIQDGFKSLFVLNKNQIFFSTSLILLTLLNIFITFFIADLYVFDNSFSEAAKYYTVGQFSGIINLTPGNIRVSEVFLISLQSLFVYKTSEILVISIIGRVTDFLLLLVLNFFVKKTN